LWQIAGAAATEAGFEPGWPCCGIVPLEGAGGIWHSFFNGRVGGIMDGPERLGDIAAIERLNADYAYCLDRDDLDGFLALFIETALYTNGPRRSEGRDAIAEFFRSRTAGGARTSRHVFSGLRIDFDNEARARGTSVWVSFAANGAPPIHMATPFLVADMDDVYEFEDGRWKFAERHITPVFIDPDVPPPGASRER